MYKYIKYAGVVNTKPNKPNSRQVIKFLYNLIAFAAISTFILIFFLFHKDIIALTEHHWNNFIRKFEIQIASNLTDEHDLRRLRGIVNSKYIWEVNPWQIRNSLLQTTQIKDANVKILLPNHLYLKVTKRQPYAIWLNHGDFFLIDAKGDIIDKNVTDEDKKRYVFITGHDALQNFEFIMNSIVRNSKQNGKILSLKFVGKRRWNMILNTGLIVKLPEKHSQKALKLLDQILEKPIANINKIGCIIDMRLLPDKILILQYK